MLGELVLSNYVEKKAAEYIQARRRKKRFYTAAAALAVMVAASTFYALVMPALTIQGDTYCGQEEHPAHSEECYGKTKVLTCPLEEERCYEEQTVLICEKEETDGHVHTDSCFREESLLICSDDTEHIHDEGCFETRIILDCEEPVREPHQHDESCYAAEKRLSFDEAEAENHQHTDECFSDAYEEESLLCNLPIHSHTLQCYSNPEADLETAAVWERSFADAELSGIWPTDVIEIAKTQLGYTESKNNYKVQQNGTDIKGYTRYGAWYGDPYGDWCAMFCSFCLHYASVDADIMPPEASCQQWVEKLTERGSYREAGDYEPKPGDLIFFDYDDYREDHDRNADHVAFVTELIREEDSGELTEIRTIEGNKKNRVVCDTYAPDSEVILGYGELPESRDSIEEADIVLTESEVYALAMPATESHITTVKVKLDWLSELPQGQSVSVTLFKDGVSLGQSLSLDASNNWTGEFSGLEPGEYSVEYTQLSGYSFSAYASTKEGSIWKSTEHMTEGNSYVLVHNNSYAVQNSSGITLSSGSVSLSGETLSDAPAYAQWSYNGTLQNEASGNYLVMTSTGVSLSGKTGSVFSYTDSGYIKLTSSNRYLRYNGGYTQTSRASYATEFVPYEKTAEYTEHTFTILGEKKQFNPNDGASSFEHNKTIDYLNDGGTNTDSSVTGVDLYRLYLDMTGKQEPMDLLIVVDGSGSMDKTDMDGRIARDTAITRFLNGRTDRVTKDGFISFFLGINSENRVSVIQFCGTSETPDNNLVSANRHDYTFDSSVLLDWTGQNSFVNCANRSNNGTNYEAGLMRATDQFSRVTGDGHRKLMIFLSDGVPTYFLINPDDVGTVCGNYTISAEDVGKRWGNGQYAAVNNYPYCKEPTKRAFDSFMQSNPGVTVFTIGVSSDISETSQSDSQSPEVLKYMAEKGGGSFLSVMSSMDELKNNVESIFYPAGVTITDALSEYVRYYAASPDVLVTMTDKLTGDVTVLYRDGAVTDAGNGILTDVSYTDGDTGEMPSQDTGRISAVFDTEYRFSPKYTYTLSFNVETTKTAYREYAAGGYNAAGDRGTDYGENDTSSEKPGFFSNTYADVSYIVSGDRIKEEYRMPVVQVSNYRQEIVFVKTDITGKRNLPNAKFALYGADESGEILPEPIAEYKKLVSDKDGVITPEGFSLPPGLYYLAELAAPDGYIPMAAPLKFQVEAGKLTVYGDGVSQEVSEFSADFENGICTVFIRNSSGYVLPETGGSGVRFLSGAGILLMAIPVTFLCVCRLRRERRHG